MLIPEEDRATYSEGMHRGGTTVIVTVDEAYVARAADILEEHGSVNLDEREESWRQEGLDRLPLRSGRLWLCRRNVGRRCASCCRHNTSDRAERERIPIVEEKMRVGKRQVEGGRVKVRSYVVETPVEEQVLLRQETVHVERRPVDRELSDATDATRFAIVQSRWEERDEEAVVSKEARVKEEVVVSKKVEQRTQTVSDKVFRTEVDIDDSRKEDSAGRMTGTPSLGGANPARSAAVFARPLTCRALAYATPNSRRLRGATDNTTWPVRQAKVVLSSPLRKPAVASNVTVPLRSQLSCNE